MPYIKTKFYARNIVLTVDNKVYETINAELMLNLMYIRQNILSTGSEMTFLNSPVSCTTEV